MRVKEAVERNEGWNDMDDLELIAAVKTYKVIEKIADGCSGDEKYKLQKDGEILFASDRRQDDGI